MNHRVEMPATLAQRIERRRVLARALALVGAAAGLGACRHLSRGAGAYPLDRGEGDDRDGMGGAGGGGMGGGAM